MKKIINDPEKVVDEMLDGIIASFPNHFRRAPGTRRTVMYVQAPVKDKVAVITGGGSGHLPLFLGYTGKGLLDGTAVGDVFSSPSSNEIFQLTSAVHGGRGVLYLYGNYGGDIMNFDMAADLAGDEDMEIGMGIHGERGVKREKLRPADEIVETMTGRVLDDLPFNSGDEVAVLINGLGATAPMELFVMARGVHRILENHGIRVYKSFVGEYATSMEMKGASISLFRLDAGLKSLLDAPCFSPFLSQQLY